MSDPGKLRILHLPQLVGGHAPALAVGERALGMGSSTLAYISSPFGYPADVTLRHTSSGAFRRWMERLETVWRVRGRYDVLHFNFGTSLLTSENGWLTLADMPLYGSGVAKVMTYQGSDLRIDLPPEAEASLAAEIAKNGSAHIDVARYRSDPLRKRLILKRRDKAVEDCDHLYALNPDLLNLLPQEKSGFLPYAIRLDDHWKAPTIESDDAKPLKVLHLATDRVLKGSALIEQAIAPLVDEGKVEFRSYANIPRDMALAHMREADVLIDQMVLGWYGAQAVEAMMMGKAVVCRIDEAQGARIHPEMAQEMPIVSCDLDGIDTVLGRLCANRDEVRHLGDRGRQFAKRWHSPQSVGTMTVGLYQKLKAR